MQLNDKPTLHYRHGEEQRRIIEDDVVPFLDQYKSENDFTRQAIHNNARPLQGIAEGGKVSERLVLLFDEIRGIDEKLPDRSAEARIKNEGLAENQSIKLGKEPYGWLKNIIKEVTHLDKSKATRYCNVCQLANVARGTDILDDWQHDAVIRTEMELKKSLESPKLNLYYILVERFVMYLDSTEYFIAQDPRPFEDFAEAYKKDFHETRPYNELKEELGERVFTNVENTIEEYTDISFEPDSESSGFLEKYLEE